LSLKSVVEKNTTRSGRAFDLVIVFLIVTSLLSYSVETLPNLSEEWRKLLRVAEVVIVALFTVEYLLRITVADRKWGFVFSFYGLVDLVAILPFYVATGMDLRAIRIVRLLRLFRAFKLVRYSKAIRLFHRAFSIAKEELVLFFLVAMMMMFFAAAGIHYFENEAQPEAFSSVFSSFWREYTPTIS